MKEKKIYINGKITTLLAGQNSNENNDAIDECEENDLWFHSKDGSSGHVVALLPADFVLEKKDYDMIIKEGAIFCKENTAKIRNLNKVHIIYTEIKNITKTKEKGKVFTKNTKTIIV